jgi:serine/threonine protein kinase
MNAPVTFPALAARSVVIHERIGVGGTSTVYRGALIHPSSASDASDTQVAVAVKVLHRADQHGIDGSLTRERLLAARLADIDGVVEIVDVTVVDEQVAIVSPLYATSAADRVASLGMLDVAEVVAIGRSIAETLDRVHRRGVVHGDIKPSNVLLGRPGRPDAVALADFGVATLVGDRTWTQSAAMSLPYAAPERIDGAPASITTDLYALGATLFHLIVGRAPFVGESGATESSPGGLAGLVHRIATDPPPATPTYVPDELRRLVDDLLAKQPTDRPQHASTVVQRLADVAPVAAARSGAPTEPTDAIAAAAHRRRWPLAGALRHRRRLVVSIAAVAAAASGATAVSLTGADDRSAVVADRATPIRPDLEPPATTSPRPRAESTPDRVSTRDVDPAAVTSTATTTTSTPTRTTTTSTPGTTAATTTLSPSTTRSIGSEANPVGDDESTSTAPPPVAAEPAEPAAPADPSPQAPATPAPAPPTTVAVGPCGTTSVVVCEDFTAGSGDWIVRQDSEVSTISIAGSVAFTHNDAGRDGGSFLRRGIALPDAAESVTLRMRVRFDTAGGSDWGMVLMSIVSDADALWNLNAFAGDAGTVRITTYHQDAAGNSGSASRDFSVEPATWYCLALSVSPSSTSSMRVSLDGVEQARMAGPLPATLTPVMSASIGAVWVGQVAQAPDLAVDDVSVSADGDASCNVAPA